MFYNYLKLAWRVLGRKKFFTAISLFGISFTLAILMLIVSFFETQFGKNAPLQDRDRMIYVTRVQLQDIVIDTTFNIDSSMVNGQMVFDSIMKFTNESRSTTTSSISIRFLQNYYSNLDHAENFTIYVPGVSFNSYINNTKIVLNLNYTDYNYWDIMHFDFIEGRAYDKSMFDLAEQVVVITDKLAKEYFGREENILGENIFMDGKNHKVIGVVKKPYSAFISADIFTPMTLMSRYPGKIEEYTGPAECIFLAKSRASVSSLKNEILGIAEKVPMDIIPNYNKFNIYPATISETVSNEILWLDDATKAKHIMVLILGSFIALFVLLPTLNLINLNVSRILERSSEIGVRKAFGASKMNILMQFVFENIVLTVLGGIIGFLLAMILINLLNNSGLLNGNKLSINLSFFIYSFLIIIFFGIISGTLPAYRMSKLNIVKALKENQL